MNFLKFLKGFRWGRSPLEPYNERRLKDYSDQELYEILQNNEKTVPVVLACVCSEVLRRKIQKKRGMDEKT